MIESTDPDTINRFSGQSGYQIVDSRTGCWASRRWPSSCSTRSSPPTNDIRIRQALAQSLDQATIQKIFGGGFAKPVNGLFLPGSELLPRHRLPAPTTRRRPRPW